VLLLLILAPKGLGEDPEALAPKGLTPLEPMEPLELGLLPNGSLALRLEGAAAVLAPAPKLKGAGLDAVEGAGALDEGLEPNGFTREAAAEEEEVVDVATAAFFPNEKGAGLAETGTAAAPDAPPLGLNANGLALASETAAAGAEALIDIRPVLPPKKLFAGLSFFLESTLLLEAPNLNAPTEAEALEDAGVGFLPKGLLLTPSDTLSLFLPMAGDCTLALAGPPKGEAEVAFFPKEKGDAFLALPAAAEDPNRLLLVLLPNLGMGAAVFFFAKGLADAAGAAFGASMDGL
jgi:hypothetical protein